MAVTPDDRSSIVIKKSFGYRGGSKVWGNRYHFEGDTPASPAAWTTFADAIVAAEKAIFGPEVTIVEAIGYDFTTASTTNPNGVSVFTKGYTTIGTGVFSAVEAPGDVAATIKYITPARSVKNHPVYLMNYYHGVHLVAGGGDDIDTAQTAALEAYADEWIAGFSDGAGTHERCGPHGAVAIDKAVSGWARHRDFPR